MRIRMSHCASSMMNSLQRQGLPGKVPGDQDYITASMRSNGIAAACFPTDMVASFKMAIRLGLTQPACGRQSRSTRQQSSSFTAIRKCTGFRPTYRFFKYGLRYALHGQFSFPFSVQELAATGQHTTAFTAIDELSSSRHGKRLVADILIPAGSAFAPLVRRAAPMKRVLIVRTSAIGDVVFASPFAAAIKRSHPDACRLAGRARNS